jgi:hypothetical protein
MKKIFLITLFALFFGATDAFAHQAFTLVSSEKKTVKQSDLPALEKSQTNGKIEKSNLTLTEKEIRLVVTTGPEDDMLSYRVQGVRNPNLVVPSGATLKILFVNTDYDMRHDIRFGHVMGEFALAPEITETAGSAKLTARSEDDILQAEEIVIKAGADGGYKYFCSVRGHAKGGMWGNIFVGVKPEENVKMAEKQKHVHTDDEDHDHDKMTDDKTKTEKPSEEMPDMKTDEEKSDSMTQMNHKHDSMTMSSTVDINTPMTQEGSGTSWLPASSPMYAYMKMFDDGGMLMLHGTMFARYTSVGSTRDLSVRRKRRPQSL